MIVAAIMIIMLLPAILGWYYSIRKVVRGSAYVLKENCKSQLKTCKIEYKEYLYTNGKYGGNKPDTKCRDCGKPFYAWESYYYSCRRCYFSLNTSHIRYEKGRYVGNPYEDIKEFQRDLKNSLLCKNIILDNPLILEYKFITKSYEKQMKDRVFLRIKLFHILLMNKIVSDNKEANRIFNKGKKPFEERLNVISESLLTSIDNGKFEYNSILKEVDPNAYPSRYSYRKAERESFDGGIDIGSDY